MMQWKSKGLVTLGAAVLAACGGGGSSPTSTPAPAETRLALSAANQQAAARVAMTAIDFSLGAADMGSGRRSALASLTRRQALAVRPLAVVGPDATVPCPKGGSIVISLEDANRNGSLDQGDTLSTELRACNSDEGLISGKLVASVREFSSSQFSTRVVMALDVQNLSTQLANGDQQTGNGSFMVTLQDTGTGVSTVLVEAPRFELSGRRAGQTYSTQVSQLRVQTQDEANRVPQQTLLNASATQIQSSEFGGLSVSLQTDPDFSILAGDIYPSSGAALVQGAGGSRIRLVALNAQQVRVDLDANGDGSYESNATYNWPLLGP